MPPLAQLALRMDAAPGSPEAALYRDFLVAKDWLDE